MNRYKLPPAWGNEFSFVEPMHRFMNSIEVSGKCWLWQKGTDVNGYGQFSIRGVMLKAHRFIYEVYENKIPADKEIDHLCRQKNCVNPEHLEAVPHSVNMKRISLSMSSCRAGHEYNEVNTRNYLNKQGKLIRTCRVCDRTRRRNARAKIHQTI